MSGKGGGVHGSHATKEEGQKEEMKRARQERKALGGEEVEETEIGGEMGWQRLE
jgi:hypothetical protein